MAKIIKVLQHSTLREVPALYAHYLKVHALNYLDILQLCSITNLKVDNTDFGNIYIYLTVLIVQDLRWQIKLQNVVLNHTVALYNVTLIFLSQIKLGKKCRNLFLLQNLHRIWSLTNIFKLHFHKRGNNIKRKGAKHFQ